MPWRVANYMPRLLWLQIGIGLLTLVIAAVWTWQSWSERRSTAIADARQNAALVSEYTSRLLLSQKLLLAQIDNIVADDPGAGEDTLHRKLRILDAGFEHTTSLGIFGADGQARAGSRTYPLSLDISERPYFQFLRDHADPPIYIDRVVLRPAGTDTLLVARRLSGEGFHGVATASAEIKNLTDFLSGASGQSKVAFLMRADGKLLVRPSPYDPPVMMRPDGPVMTAVRQGDAGIFDAPGYMDGIARTYAFQRIENMPIYAIHGFSRGTLLNGVLVDMIPVYVFLLVLAVLSYVALSAVVRRIQADRARQVAEFDRRLLEDARRGALLKETLLKEMNHRIHNNLQMIQALIYARSRTAGEAAATLKEIGKRVWAISEVHNLLYNTAEYASLNLGAFLRTMANNPGIVPPEQGILVKCETNRVDVRLEHAVPAALIVLEFLTNALKHAFPDGRQGSIVIALRERGGEAEITVSDDGVGLPAERKRNSGMGLTEVLASQIGGRLEAGASPTGGTCMILRFPLADGEASLESASVLAAQ